MARTQAADYDQKRDAITSAAAKLFAKQGFAGASLADIAAACDTSKSLIYHYYASKEAILYDVMRAHIDVLLEAVDEVSALSGPSDGKFRALARALMQRYVGAADSQKVLLYELGNLPAAQRKEIVEKQRKIIDFAEGLLTESAKKKLDHGTLRAQVMLFFGQLNWTHNWFKSSGPVSRDAIADMAASAALGAITASTS